jgi:hypothetical protein
MFPRDTSRIDRIYNPVSHESLPLRDHIHSLLDFGACHENFVSLRCHLENGVDVVHPLQGQTGGSQRESDVGCELDGKEESMPFL